MVQLKEILSEKAFKRAKQFQFLNGSIKRIDPIATNPIYLDFNSSMVQLKVIGKNWDGTRDTISIPQWFN